MDHARRDFEPGRWRGPGPAWPAPASRALLPTSGGQSRCRSSSAGSTLSPAPSGSRLTRSSSRPSTPSSALIVSSSVPISGGGFVAGRAAVIRQARRWPPAGVHAVIYCARTSSGKRGCPSGSASCCGRHSYLPAPAGDGAAAQGGLAPAVANPAGVRCAARGAVSAPATGACAAVRVVSAPLLIGARLDRALLQPAGGWSGQHSRRRGIPAGPVGLRPNTPLKSPPSDLRADNLPEEGATILMKAAALDQGSRTNARWQPASVLIYPH